MAHIKHNRSESLTRSFLILSLALVVASLCWANDRCFAYSANRVWFEFRPSGIYRVYVNYTVPALKEFRESYVEFRKKKDAERFYWDLLRGADFYPSDPQERRFTQPPLFPKPW